MQVEWQGRRQWVPCYLADILVIAEGTGQHISAVRQLPYEDLRFADGSRKDCLACRYYPLGARWTGRR